MSRPSSAGIAVPAYIDVGRSGRFGRPPSWTQGPPSTSQDVTASRLMQQNMGSSRDDERAEDSIIHPIQSVAEEILRDDVLLRTAIRALSSPDIPDIEKSVGLFITVPHDVVRGIEAVFPPIKNVSRRDDSPSHITLLRIGHYHSDVDTIRRTVSRVASGHGPFAVSIRGTGYFDNPDKSVLYARAVSPALDSLHDDIREALECDGFDIEHSDFAKYIGHMTLNYLPPSVRIRHVCPEYSWTVDRFEMWGCGSPIMFRLGCHDEPDSESTASVMPEFSAVGGLSGMTGPITAPRHPKKRKYKVT